MDINLKTPVYKKVWFMVLISVLFPVVGILLMWKYKQGWHKIIKVVLTGVASIWFLFLLIFCFAMGSDTSSISSDTTQTLTTNKLFEEEIITEITTNSVIITYDSTSSATQETTTKPKNITTKETTTKYATTTAKVTTTAKPTTTKVNPAITTTRETTKVTAKSTTKKLTTSVYYDDSQSGQMVWIPESGSKYHSHSGCSNMKNPSKVSVIKAKQLGYTACKKCY